jgi:hypothetical protein
VTARRPHPERRRRKRLVADQRRRRAALLADLPRSPRDLARDLVRRGLATPYVLSDRRSVPGEVRAWDSVK